MIHMVEIYVGLYVGDILQDKEKGGRRDGGLIEETLAEIYLYMIGI